VSDHGISDALQNRAKERLEQVYGNSACMENCRNLLRDFESVNTYSKYRSDLDAFIRESHYEDYYDDELDTVYVSTIHKAKGREFDSVYMLLNRYQLKDDSARRVLYVGMTRAKTNLYIHCNNNILDMFNSSELEWIEDTKHYAEPVEIALSLTHRDVFLGFFKDKKELISKLRCGQALTYAAGGLTAELNGRTVMVSRLSRACLEQIAKLESKGYHPASASVRFVVAWKGEEDEEESAVLLPTITLRRDMK
jgi:ATP-dependent DNA helicase RecQ